MEDDKIVELLFKRDEGALVHIKEKYAKYLAKISFNILGDTPSGEECLNDTYLAAWNSIPPNRPKYLSAYLAKIIRAISIDALRKRGSYKRKGSQYTLCLEELNSAIPGGDNPIDQYEGKYLAALIEKWLGELKAENKEIFLRRYFYMDSLKEIATRMNKSESALKGILFRERAKLKEFLEKEGYTI